MVLGVTGHRPSALGWGYDYNNKYWLTVKEQFKDFLLQHNVTKVYSGMALGLDTVCAMAVIELQDEGHVIELVAAIPCISQSSVWPEVSRKLYDKLISRTSEKVVVCEGEYRPWFMQRRNEYIVDNVDEMWSLFNGNKGGTYNCIQYAQKRGKVIHVLSPEMVQEICIQKMR